MAVELCQVGSLGRMKICKLVAATRGVIPHQSSGKALMQSTDAFRELEPELI